MLSLSLQEVLVQISVCAMPGCMISVPHIRVRGIHMRNVSVPSERCLSQTCVRNYQLQKVCLRHVTAQKLRLREVRLRYVNVEHAHMQEVCMQDLRVQDICPYALLNVIMYNIGMRTTPNVELDIRFMCGKQMKTATRITMATRRWPGARFTRRYSCTS